jgi:hypothetical protein
MSRAVDAIVVLAVLPFPLIFRKKKELMGKEREPS